MAEFPKVFLGTEQDVGKRLDQYLAGRLAETSRARIQRLVTAKKVLVDGAPRKPSFRLRGAEKITVLGAIESPALRAIPEEIPLDIVYQDADLVVVNKPAGMMVHAGAGATENDRNRGTLVNALLYRCGQLSTTGGELRPGIVHRLDKATSGLIVVAKNDASHRKLAAQFARRQVRKTYLALVHGWVQEDRGTITKSIRRDRVRRTRMTTRRSGGREAVTRYSVEQRIHSRCGRFTFLRLEIDTGRTHQIRVHLASLGHPVVGDTLYGAPREIHGKNARPISLARNFLHAAELRLEQPRTGESLAFSLPLPRDLRQFLERLTK
jgi:23S rRNA pseudouridine1911/1915/1917 synthase